MGNLINQTLLIRFNKRGLLSKGQLSWETDPLAKKKEIRIVSANNQLERGSPKHFLKYIFFYEKLAVTNLVTKKGKIR